MTVDRVLADPLRGMFVAHPPGDLLGRPARAQAAFDLIAHQLAPSRSSCTPNSINR